MKLFYALGFFGQLQTGVTATDYEGKYFSTSKIKINSIVPGSPKLIHYSL